ncbi:MAG TPA: hypothetical protein VEP28_13275 [Rubrobacter sp.]|nr:hypothetical protein [Rubrobacter sp.]
MFAVLFVLFFLFFLFLFRVAVTERDEREVTEPPERARDREALWTTGEHVSDDGPALQGGRLTTHEASEELGIGMVSHGG